MKIRFASTLAAAVLCALGAGAHAQDAEVNADKARANFARPIVLAADDVRAYPKPPAGFADAQPGSAHGTVEPFTYASIVTGTRRAANVWLPPGYDKARRYPVLYLLHGIGGNQDEWRGYVRSSEVLDNLMAAGKVVPMIVVMPNGRALADDRAPPQDKVFTQENAAGFARFERDLLESLIPAVDAAYPTQADGAHRAIGGLSMGGGQSLNFGLAHPEAFAWVAGFSPAPNTDDPARLAGAAVKSGSRLKLVYLSCGNRDGLINVAQGVHRKLREQGVAHKWNVDEYGHDRDSWAENLYHYAQQLFR
ncbi:esterase family protein [Massilia sp. TW-1]|uniref:Esterase family protein n=1 Tax=Telluria antibiotica TaxID=2717319 RepID=A0ABX0P6N4_9BURK|nr:alpha/beta hydrolase-fold protein [Telluria antibiotica]NIA52911.1 esterase family protein [Telluria antibiotica]